MTTKARIRSICAVCHQAFEIADNDKVFFDNGNVTRTVCVPCQEKIKKIYGFGFKCGAKR